MIIDVSSEELMDRIVSLLEEDGRLQDAIDISHWVYGNAKSEERFKQVNDNVIRLIQKRDQPAWTGPVFRVGVGVSESYVVYVGARDERVAQAIAEHEFQRGNLKDGEAVSMLLPIGSDEHKPDVSEYTADPDLMEDLNND